MKKRKDFTPNSQITSALRRLFLRSRERAAVLRRDSYTCTICNKKQTKKKGKELKVCVHHLHGINWQTLIEVVRECLLCEPKYMVTLCQNCHKNEHEK